MRVTAHLQRPTRKFPRAAGANQRFAYFPIWSCSRRGLPSRRMLPPTRCALTAPFHPYLPADSRHRRSAFCCTFRGLTPPRCYLAPHPVEPGLSSAIARSDCLADSRHKYTASSTVAGRRSGRWVYARQRLIIEFFSATARNAGSQFRGARCRQLRQKDIQHANSLGLPGQAAGFRAAHDDHQLASRHVRVGPGPLGKIRQGSPVNGLVPLRQFARDRRVAGRRNTQPCREAMPRSCAALRRKRGSGSLRPTLAGRPASPSVSTAGILRK